MKNPVVQCHLHSKECGDLICWLDADRELKEGMIFTLKDHEDPEARWKVVSVGTVVKDKSTIHRPGAFFDSDI